MLSERTRSGCGMTDAWVERRKLRGISLDQTATSLSRNGLVPRGHCTTLRGDR